MKQSGKCTKCGGEEVYSNDHHPSRGDRCRIPGENGRTSTSLWLDTFICLDCGYVEEYIESESLRDEKKMAITRDTWRKVSK